MNFNKNLALADLTGVTRVFSVVSVFGVLGRKWIFRFVSRGKNKLSTRMFPSEAVYCLLPVARSILIKRKKDGPLRPARIHEVMLYI